MKKKKNLYNIFKNHTLEEYKAKYDVSKAIVLSKDAVDKFNKNKKAKSRGNVFNGRNWWLIDNTYYEVGKYLEIKSFIHKSHNAGFKIALASILGGVGIAGALSGGGYIVYKTIVNAPKQDIKVTGVTLSPTSLELGKSDTSTLVATVSPNNATDKSLTWSSSNSNIVAVDKNGVLTGVNEGDATITVKTNDGGFTATCEVTVKTIIHVTSVKLDRTSLTQYPGVKDQLIATVYPENATNKNVKWESSDKTVCSVDNEGKISGIKDGTAKITVTSEDGGFTQSCIVTIKGTFIDVTPLTDTTCSVSITSKSVGEVCVPSQVTINGKTYDTVEFNSEGLSVSYPNENVTSIKFEENNKITKIDDQAFAFCPNLTSINLEACTNLKEIGEQAFGYQYYSEECHAKVESITLPESLESIGKECFNNCSELKTINNFAKTKITIIADYTFYNCSKLESIDLTNITSIGLGAFFNCSSLCSNGENLIIPKNCTSIAGDAFEGCNEIKTLIIENETIPEIDDYTYTGLYGSIDTLYIPTGTSPGRQITRTFTKAASSEKEGFDKYVFNSIGYTYKEWNPGDVRCYIRAGANFSDTNLTIKNTDEISGDAKNLGGIQGNGFKNKTCVESITFDNRPGTFYTIEKGAFEGCTNLKSIDFGTTSKHFLIYEDTFKNCSSLESIDLTYVQYMYGTIFYGCKNLQTIILPDESATEELFYTNETGVFTYVGEESNPAKRIIKVKKNLTLPDEHYLKVHASDYTITFDDDYWIYNEK